MKNQDLLVCELQHKLDIALEALTLISKYKVEGYELETADSALSKILSIDNPTKGN